MSKTPIAHAHKCDEDRFGRFYHIDSKHLDGPGYRCSVCGDTFDEYQDAETVEIGPHPEVLREVE